MLFDEKKSLMRVKFSHKRIDFSPKRIKLFPKREEINCLIREQNKLSPKRQNKLSPKRRKFFPNRIKCFSEKMKLSPLEKQAIICQIKYAYHPNDFCFQGNQNYILPIKYHLELTRNYLSERYYLSLLKTIY